MNAQQHRRQPQPFYDVNARTLGDKKMCVGRSPAAGTYPSPPLRRERKIEIASKSPQGASWWKNNEAKRKRRVAKYRLYDAEGKLKSSLKRGFRSLKITCMKIVTNL